MTRDTLYVVSAANKLPPQCKDISFKEKQTCIAKLTSGVNMRVSIFMSPVGSSDTLKDDLMTTDSWLRPAWAEMDGMTSYVAHNFLKCCHNLAADVNVPD